MKTAIISGLGGRVEFVCQKALSILLEDKRDTQLLAELLKEVGNKGFDNIFENYKFISRRGREEWLARVPDDQTFEFDGTEKSIPVRD